MIRQTFTVPVNNGRLVVSLPFLARLHFETGLNGQIEVSVKGPKFHLVNVTLVGGDILIGPGDGATADYLLRQQPTTLPSTENTVGGIRANKISATNIVVGTQNIGRPSLGALAEQVKEQLQPETEGVIITVKLPPDQNTLLEIQGGYGAVDGDLLVRG